MDIPLEEFQRIILEQNPLERENILQEIVKKYQVMYVRVLGKLHELIGEEEYQRIINDKEVKKEIKEVKEDVQDMREDVKDVRLDIKEVKKDIIDVKEEIKVVQTEVKAAEAASGFIQEVPTSAPLVPFNGNAYSYHKELRFCKVRSKEKKPFETDWVNKPYTWDDIQEHIRKSTNYGVLCGYGGLVVIDCDDKKFADAIANELPKTFSVRTGGGGVHYYFFCQELSEKKIVLKNGKEHYGEMQAKGAQVVAAGSVHPNGKTYEVLSQLPIATMSRENILEVLKPYMQEVNEEEKKAIEYNKEFFGGDDIGSLPITNVISISGFRRLHSGEYQGKNPWHGSQGGINFNVNLSKNIAFCWRCNAGISVVQAIALKEGIITSCTDEVRGENFLRVKQIAIQKYGYVDKKSYQPITEEDLSDEEREISMKVLELIILKRKDEATEMVVDYIKSKNHIYSTIDDKQPEIWFYDKGVYVPNGKTKIEEITRRILRMAYIPLLATRIIEKIRTDTLIEKEDFFKNESIWEVPIQNGIFNLLTKELKPFDPTRIFFNKLPVYYEPEAKCPAIDQHLKDVLTHESDTQVMYEIIGFLLCKDYFIEKAIMMVGNGRNGKGKCETERSKILMSNGDWKSVKDVKVGDEVISPQFNGSFKFSKVIHTHNRFEPDIYEVKECSGKKRLLYECADNHLIPIYKFTTKELPAKDGKRKRRKFKILTTMEARDIAKYSKTNIVKSNITSFTTSAVDYKNNKDENINPYLLGAFLGDGSLSKDNGYCIFTFGKEKEIIADYLKKFYEVKTENKKNIDTIDYYLGKGLFTEQLSKLGIKEGINCSNKFIPKSCLLSSLKYRWELLAGLIDTDGFIDKAGAIYYTTKSPALADDIKYLVHSLGGFAEIRDITKSCQNGFIGNYKEVSIQFKNKTLIPLKTWKRERLKEIENDPRIIGIDVSKKKGPGEMVYGIQIDSPSHWYITNNWMVTHNTIDLIKRFLGVENCASIPLTALTEDSFRIGELFGKMANLAGDLSSTALKDTSLFKQTTGRDLIGAKRKFLSDIKFMNYAKHIFACNDLPRVYDFSKGFWNRWVLLEFPYEFIDEKEYLALTETEREARKVKIMDPTHIDKISKQEELNGLFNKALEGLQRVIQQKNFSYSRGSAEIKLFWMRKADAFLAFCYDHLEADNDNMIFKSELRKIFFEYCKRHNLKGVSDNNIKIVLEEMFGVTETRKGIDGEYKHAWVGIRLKNMPSSTLPKTT